MMKISRFCYGLVWLAAGFAFGLFQNVETKAASFASDFNAGKPSEVNLYGTAAALATGGIGNSGMIKLTANSNNQQGSMVFDDLDGGKPISGFTAAFKLMIGGGTGADGFSFSFGPDLPRGPFGEEGAGNGLIISFDTRDNGNREAPAIDVRFGGVLIASKAINPRTGDEFVDVVINVDPDGSLDLSYGKTVVFTNIFAFVPSAGRFGFGARTGGANDNHSVDDLAITTKLLDGPFVRSVTPRGVATRPDAPLTIELQDAIREVNPGTVKLTFNGANIIPTVSKELGLTAIKYSFPQRLPSGSTNSIRLSYEDNSIQSVPRTAHFDFVVDKYLTIPSRFAMTTNLVDTNRIGFRVRSVQARADANLPATVARAEAQLAGTLIDPATGQPYLNEALAGPNPDKSFNESLVINYEPERTPTGNFIDVEGLVPGIPGTGQHTFNAAVEIITYLYLPVGYHKLGVNSDDGFRLTVGEREARDAFSLVVGQYDGARDPADSLFSVATETAGFYAFRLVWFQGTAGASLEFYSVLDDNTYVLINDKAPGIRAFRDLKTGVPTPPFVQSVSPQPDQINVSRRPQINIVLKDQGLQVAPASVRLALNDMTVQPVVTKTSSTTSISFQPTAPLGYASLNTIRLVYNDSASPPNTVNREWRFTTAPMVLPTGQWDFENGTLAATFGQDLTFGDTEAKEVSSRTAFGTTTSFGIPDIGGQPAKVMRFNRLSTSGVLQPGYVLRHGIAPNGGGSKVNQWTLLMDLFFPEPQNERFTSLIQTDDMNSDADLFVRWNNIGGENTGGIGVNGQYAGEGRTFVSKRRWHRIALAVDLTSDSPVISKFIDGVKFEDQFLTAPQIDGRFALGKILRLFADDSNQLNTFFVNSIQVLDGKLIDDEIAALGGPSAAGIPASVKPPPSTPPTLSFSVTSGNIRISWPNEFSGFTLESTESLASRIWSPVTGVSNNSITVTVGSSARFFRLRR